MEIKEQTNSREHPLKILEQWYPLYFMNYSSYFTLSERDSLTCEEYSCGKVPVLYLETREDFIKLLQKTIYKGTNNPVPNSMGAVTISGLRKWDYKNYLIVLTKGFYSSLPCELTTFGQAEWLEYSFIIRKYHELAHFICRKKYADLKNVIQDEIIADCLGLLFATGSYDTGLAKCFLGIETKEYRQGMRLENYVSKENNLSAIVDICRSFIQELSYLVQEVRIEKTAFENTIDLLYPKASVLYQKLTQ